MAEITRKQKTKRMSRIVIQGDTIYLAGHTAPDSGADVAGQTQQVLDLIESRLAEAGSDKHHILSTTIWLADISDFDTMNGVWDAWVSADAPPARATVEAKLARPELRVEIAAIAAVTDVR